MSRELWREAMRSRPPGERVSFELDEVRCNCGWEVAFAGLRLADEFEPGSAAADTDRFSGACLDFP